MCCTPCSCWYFSAFCRLSQERALRAPPSHLFVPACQPLPASRLRVTMVSLPIVGHLEPLIGLGEALASSRQRIRVRLLSAVVRRAAALPARGRRAHTLRNAPGARARAPQGARRLVHSDRVSIEEVAPSPFADRRQLLAQLTMVRQHSGVGGGVRAHPCCREGARELDRRLHAISSPTGDVRSVSGTRAPPAGMCGGAACA